MNNSKLLLLLLLQSMQNNNSGFIAFPTRATTKNGLGNRATGRFGAKIAQNVAQPNVSHI
jgi:hypothetical protein